jgi:acetate kinase
MGTRSGDHDPAIDLYMMEEKGYSAAKIYSILNKKSGLLGITGKYIDRRDIRKAAENGGKRSQLAIRIEGYRGRKYIGAYVAAIGTVDAVVFTAGAGEMNPELREQMLENLDSIGIVLDHEKNRISQTRNAETDITAPGSRTRIFVIPTDEELVMVEDAVALLEGRYDVHTNFTYSFQHSGYVNNLRKEAFKREVKENPALRSVCATPPGAHTKD